MNDVRDVIIIGGGPAGYTAALYAARANLNPLVIEGFNWGGQLMITSDVENYPGYADGMLGPEMMPDFRAQAERFGAEFLTDDVTRVDFSEQPFQGLRRRRRVPRGTVIVATGATARQLGLDSERALHGRGVTYCATCDAAFYRDKEVVVVGGGDSAMEEAHLPDEIRHARSRSSTGATSSARRRSWSTARSATRRSSSSTPYVVEEVLGVERQAAPASGCATSRPARRATTPPTALRRDRPRPDDGALRRPARPRRERLPDHGRQVDRDEHPGRVRGGRRPGSRVPAGGHRRRLGLRRRARRGAVPRRGRRPSRGRADRPARAHRAGLGSPPGHRPSRRASLISMGDGKSWIDLLDPTADEVAGRSRSEAGPARARGARRQRRATAEVLRHRRSRNRRLRRAGRGPGRGSRATTRRSVSSSPATRHSPCGGHPRMASRSIRPS